jgi:hypothetical protein
MDSGSWQCRCREASWMRVVAWLHFPLFVLDLINQLWT